MEGKIIKVLTTFIVKLEDGKTAKTNIVPSFANAINWLDLEVGDSVTNLKWKSEKDRIIDGDSPVERI